MADDKPYFEPIEAIDVAIYDALPYVMDDSHSYLEFTGAVLKKTNELVKQANDTADVAVDAHAVATGIDGKAQSALDNSVDALDVANGIDGKAQSALDTANGIDAKATSALSQAGAAVVTANAAGMTAGSAVSTANAANAAAGTAVTTANAANATAGNALTVANGIDSKATTALNSAATALSNANTALSRSIASTVTTYGTSASGTDPETVTSWQSSPMAVAQGEYLWTRTVDTFQDATTATRYSVARMGVDGAGVEEVEREIIDARDGHVALNGRFAAIEAKTPKIEYASGTEVEPTGAWSEGAKTNVTGFYWQKTRIGEFVSEPELVEKPLTGDGRNLFVIGASGSYTTAPNVLFNVSGNTLSGIVLAGASSWAYKKQPIDYNAPMVFNANFEENMAKRPLVRFIDSSGTNISSTKTLPGFTYSASYNGFYSTEMPTVINTSDPDVAKIQVGLVFVIAGGTGVGTRVAISNIKLELGTIATPWQPAPEDTHTITPTVKDGRLTSHVAYGDYVMPSVHEHKLAKLQAQIDALVE